MTQAEKRYWKNWEIKMEQVKEDQASREAQFYTPDTPNVTLDFSQVYFKEVSDEKYDVIDPMANDIIY